MPEVRPDRECHRDDCEEPATTTVFVPGWSGKGEDLPVCDDHADDDRGPCEWCGELLDAGESSSECPFNPANDAELSVTDDCPNCGRTGSLTQNWEPVRGYLSCIGCGLGEEELTKHANAKASSSHHEPGADE